MRSTFFLLGALGALVAAPAAAQAPARFLTTGRIVRQGPALDQVVAPGAQLEIIASGFGHVEGPVWVADSSMLLFSDTPTRTIYRWTADNKRTKFLEYSGYTGRMPYSKEPGSNGMALDGRGNLLICEHGDRRLAVLPLAEKSGKRTLADNCNGERFNSPNDVVASANGTLYFTDPPFGLPQQANDPRREAPVGALYRRAPDGKVTRETTELARPNGLAFSPDGRTLYVSNADSLRPVILAYDVKGDGRLGKSRPFFDMSQVAGRRPKEAPDGLKTDAAGNVYASGFGGILVLSPQGQHLGTLDPGASTANCAWGDDGRTLYITAGTFVCRVKTLAQGKVGN
ncbi:MAG: SMP-30/gluconolactonase/LRE family protein [Janthinobacterium lividum]